MENISQLLTSLTGALEDKTRAFITNNMPQTPTAIIYAGEKAFEAKADVDATLKGVWRGRADDLCQLRYDKGEYKLLQEGVFHKLNEDEIIEKIDAMFALEQSFRSMDGLLLCLVINTADYSDIDGFKEAYLSLDHLKDLLGMSFASTMKLVLLDESGKGRALASAVRVYLRGMLEQNDLRSRTTVILSNRLKNGALLAGERIRENYNLVGTLILLANGSNGSVRALYDKMFPMSQKRFLTAAYASKRKPNRKICEVIINTALDWLDKQFEKGEMLSTDRMSQALEISGGSMKIIERSFQQFVAEKLPKRDDLEFLPRNTANLDNIGGLPFKEYNRITMGGFELFYKNAITEVFASEQMKKLFREAFVKTVHQQFSPKEAARYINSQSVEQVLSQIRYDSPNEGQPAFSYMLAKAKADYCKTVLTICEEVLMETGAAARAHIAQVRELIEEFQHSYMLDVDETVQHFYSELVHDRLSGSLGATLMDSFNQSQIDKKGMLEALHQVIQQIFAGNEIFSLPLDEEMTRRMGGNGQLVQTTIREELTNGLSEKICLQTAIVPEMVSETILVNQKDREGHAHSQLCKFLKDVFSNADCVDTGNSNSIEFVQLYALDANNL